MADNESSLPGNGATPDTLSNDLQDAAIPAEAREQIIQLLKEIASLRAEIEANNARIAELEDLADRDPLTPVVNRRAFVRELDRAKAYGDRYGGGASLIYLDLDDMKAINDRHGHGTGDKALVAVAEALVANVRSSDLVGRLGGDEFGIILARADQTAAQEKVRRLMDIIDDIEIKSGNEIIPLSVSYGVIELRSQPTAEAALAAADRAMYARKQLKNSSAG
ncbi:MAG: GGDEF domain-containing protein [Proteobacteria bacterium]|nr:GGDEF domain-containing protein [Pseudomonadota bacterium]MDA1325904.1 GGDEF domain-containing protein [Pseudomonadota bacterium]